MLAFNNRLQKRCVGLVGFLVMLMLSMGFFSQLTLAESRESGFKLKQLIGGWSPIRSDSNETIVALIRQFYQTHYPDRQLCQVKLIGYRVQIVAGTKYLMELVDGKEFHLLQVYLPVNCRPSQSCVVFEEKEHFPHEENEGGACSSESSFTNVDTE